MKKRLLLLCALSCTAFGQVAAVRYDGNVTTSATNAPNGAQAPVFTLPNAIVTLCSYPAVPVSGSACTNTVPIYSDSGLTNQISNPLKTDSQGRFGFWTNAGTDAYSVQTQNGTYVGTYTITLSSLTSGINATPSQTQTIDQPSGTTLAVSSIGYTLYADRCPGADIGTKINSCLMALPTNAAGYKVGTIILPNTLSEPSMTLWSAVVTLGPGVNLTGQGMFASSFVCTISTCLIHDASGTTAGPNQHTVLVNTVYQGFTLNGNGSSGQTIVHTKDMQGVTFRDISLDGGAGATGSSCLWLEDVNWWTERNNFDNVSTLYNCTYAVKMSAQSSNPYQPHPSFGYNNFSDFKANPTNAQYVLYMTGNPYFYSSTFNLTFNKSGAGSVIIHQDGGSEYYINQTSIHGEDQGTGGYFLEQMSSGSLFFYTGTILTGFTQTLNPASSTGAGFSHFGDAAQFGPFLPTVNYVDSVASFPNIESLATDLNTLVACGRYDITSPLNAPPAALAVTSQVHLEVFCSNNNYKSQNLYVYSGINQTTRQWQRVDANGTWGAWREVVWQDQMPLLGTAGPLPGTAIAAGACVNLIAAVTGAESAMVVTATPAYGLPAVAGGANPPLNFGLNWSTAYVSNSNQVTVPVCNLTTAPITPTNTVNFTVRVVQ